MSTHATHLRGTSHRGYLELPWGQVHFRRSGDTAGPSLLLVHQSPLSSATYEPAMAELAAHGLDTVAVDIPGFGMSDAAPEPWSIPRYASALWQIADALGLGEVHLLGQHTGAVLAAEATLQQRDRVRSLVFQGIPLYSDEERAEKAARYAPGYTPALDGSHLRVVWDRIRWLYPTISAESASRQVAEYLSVGPDYGVAYRAVFAHTTDTAALAGVPTLLLHGGDDVLDRMNDVVTAAFPDAPLVRIDGGTDFVAEEKPGEFADAVAAHVLAHTGGRADEPGFSPLYTATVEVTGGRAGRARSTTGSLDVPLSRPAERGKDSAGTDPEELFAAGYAACFGSALGVAARRRRVSAGPVTVTAAVTLGTLPGGAYGIAVRLSVSAPECPQDTLEELVRLTHSLCPYSSAVRGNIEVVTETHGGG
ncbi:MULTISPECIES: Ohr family peroxiredoxin [Streptomyces]|uniref:Ohr family peroxiredoxin n=1 Tax=Streptomyces TaxID=1883 RepID=UPI0008055345|nr:MULTISPECIES: Ohr family peroxiredoxin [unclassified Streptomyces]MYR76093.1 Ohr family peroxiredoxin [Streptomyces sp. SID4925]SBU94590.1 peroxiredoxin, Ohr subfamily [Streptomyces sp. OspMP-M45]SCD30515.1 peroxiredoxin, Ohr subfamily [Streptomyces sp. PpalLS-921]